MSMKVVVSENDREMVIASRGLEKNEISTMEKVTYLPNDKWLVCMKRRHSQISQTDSQRSKRYWDTLCRPAQSIICFWNARIMIKHLEEMSFVYGRIPFLSKFRCGKNSFPGLQRHLLLITGRNIQYEPINIVPGLDRISMYNDICDFWRRRGYSDFSLLFWRCLDRIGETFPMVPRRGQELTKMCFCIA